MGRDAMGEPGERTVSLLKRPVCGIALALPFGKLRAGYVNVTVSLSNRRGPCIRVFLNSPGGGQQGRCIRQQAPP